jgi:hypothetical protein
MSKSPYFYSVKSEIHSPCISAGSTVKTVRDGKKGNIRVIADLDFNTGNRPKQNFSEG